MVILFMIRPLIVMMMGVVIDNIIDGLEIR